MALDDNKLQEALAMHMKTSLPFSVAFQLFQDYCNLESAEKVKSMSTEQKEELEKYLREAGMIKVEA